MDRGYQIALLMAAAYLLGTIPFGLIVARLKGVDLRSAGSGNLGATNVGRAMGRRWAIAVFLLDAGKGAAATIAAGLLMRETDAGSLQRDLTWLGAGLFCVTGNILPFYLRFKGGKGVATSLGAILGIYPYLTFPGLVALALWVLLVRATGYVSAGSVLAAGSLAPVFAIIGWLAGWPLSDHWPLMGLCVALAGMILVRHRANLSRIRAGTENRVGWS